MTATPNGVKTFTVNGELTVIIDTNVTGSDGSCSSVVETAKTENDIVSFVEEEEVVDNDAVEFNDSSSVGFAKPVEGLHEMGPTPFLKKTFEMVDDVETDPVVSWSPTRTSFIVWDSYELSENVLPKYFKHSNFSSFLRQLNTYGFRKVDSDRWEFANEGFQGGKKHLLKNIKRRSKINRNKDEGTKVLESEVEVESLKKDHSSMRLEMLKLNQQQEEFSHQIDTVQDKIHGVESKLQHMINFFKRLSKDQSFVERLKRKRIKQLRELETNEFVKKLKLLHDQETQEKLPCVESDLIIRQDMPTQPKPKFDITMKDENGNPRCMLNTEAVLDDGFIGGSKTVL